MAKILDNRRPPRARTLLEEAANRLNSKQLIARVRHRPNQESVPVFANGRTLQLTYGKVIVQQNGHYDYYGNLPQGVTTESFQFKLNGEWKTCVIKLD